MAFANDIDVADDGTLYVTDTIGGSIWRAVPGGPAELWIEDELLAGTGEAGAGFPVGANGIDVDGDTVYVGVSEKASVVAVPVNADGSAGEPSIFAQLPELIDGIAIDAAGRVISTHPLANLVTRIGPDSELEVIAAEADLLDAPSSVALRANEDGSTTAYVANNSIGFGTPLGNGPSILVLELPGQEG
jgi:sugar lactone lactonase YvrE